MDPLSDGCPDGHRVLFSILDGRALSSSIVLLEGDLIASMAELDEFRNETKYSTDTRSEMNEESEKPEIEVASDEDWKDQVKAENAKLDEQAKQAEQSKQEFPPANIVTMIQMLSTQAIVSLGMIPTPDGEAEQNLPLAKHFIDMLSVLEEKCQGNLSTEEAKLLDNTLHEMRMTYVAVTKSPQAPK